MSSIDIIVQRKNDLGREVWVRLPTSDPLTGRKTTAPKGARYRLRYRTPEGESRTKTFGRRLDAERHLIAVEHTKNSGA